MKLRCSQCGNREKFFGQQSCRGSVGVLVNGDGHFLDNLEGGFDTSSLDFDEPEGPWECAVCSACVVAEIDA